MTGLLLDASVVIAALDPDDCNHSAASAIVFDSPVEMTSLDLARYEVADAIAVGRREPEKAAAVLAITETLGGTDGVVRSDMQLLVTATAIAERHSISVYDAAYVAAAEARGFTLISCDERDLVSNGLAVLPKDAL